MASYILGIDGNTGLFTPQSRPGYAYKVEKNTVLEFRIEPGTIKSELLCIHIEDVKIQASKTKLGL